MKLSGLGMTYRIRDANRKKKCIFDKVDEIKKQLNQILPEIEPTRFLPMLGHCRRFHDNTLYYGRRTSNPEVKKTRKRLQLSQMEQALYDFLIANDLNPGTVYRWFLATRVPADIKEKLETGQVSVKIAMMTAYNRKRVRDSNVGLLMMEEMRTIIRGL